MFATLKMLSIYLTLGPLAGLVGIPYTLMVGDISLLYRVAMWIMAAGVRAAGIRIELTGLEHVPQGVACIFMSNHVSNLDPPVMLPRLPGRASVLLKKQLTKIPILGTAMLLAKFVPVERGNRPDAAQASVVAAAEALRSGLHILVYPEGTRSLDGRLAAFKKGPFFLAQQTGAPIIPIAISGTESMMRKGSAAITPGVAKVQMLSAIDPKVYGSREEILQAVRGAIAAALPSRCVPLLDEGELVACGFEFLPRCLRLGLGRVGADLDMEELIPRLLADEGRVPLLLQHGNEMLGVLLNDGAET